MALHGDQPKKKVLPDPISAPIVRRIFELYLHGNGTAGPLGCTALSRLLNTADVTYKGGGSFTAKSVNTILNNRAYVGEAYFNKTDSRTGKPKPPKEWIPIIMEPIVEGAVFVDVQQRLAAHNPRKNRIQPRTASSPLLLAGLVVCRECGQTMVRAAGNGYTCYSCRPKASRSGCSGHAVPRIGLEALIVDSVHERAFAGSRLPAIGAAIARALLDRKGDLRQEIDGARAQINRIEKDMSRLMDVSYASVFAAAMDQLKQRVDDLVAQRSDVRSRITTLERRIAPARKRIPKSRLLEFANTFRTAIASAPAAAARAWINAHVAQVIVEGEQVAIQWR